MNIKDQLRGWRNSKALSRRTTYLASKFLWRIWQFSTVPEIRWQRITGWIHPDEYYQRSSSTALNRYPDLFLACSRYLGDRPPQNILSVGCSTGEELLSIAEHLPHATIIGVDINRWCLRESQRKCRGEQFDFCLRTATKFDRICDFDAIFCLAVFQRTENRVRPGITESTGIRFEQFEHEIQILDSKLRPGGLLIIDQCDFSFADTQCSRDYQVLDTDGNLAYRPRPLFDATNRKISDGQSLYRIFVKRNA
jgi:hypothetical protein